MAISFCLSLNNGIFSFSNVLNSSLIFAAIYFSRNNFITPVTRKGKMICGIFIGVISFILNLFGFREGVFIVFSIVMLGYLFYQKIKYKA